MKNLTRFLNLKKGTIIKLVHKYDNVSFIDTTIVIILGGDYKKYNIYNTDLKLFNRLGIHYFREQDEILTK